MKTQIGTSSLIDYIIDSHQLICFINDMLDHCEAQKEEVWLLPGGARQRVETLPGRGR